MKTLDRYIAATFIKNLIQAVLGLTVLYQSQEVLRQLLDHAYPTHQILYFNLLDLPNIMVQMTPPAVLLATVLTISGFNRTNELTACYSIGVGLSRIVSVIVSLVFIVACFSLVLQDRILPLFFKKKTTYEMVEMKKRTDFYLDIKQNKIWYRSKNLIYNLRTFDPQTKIIYGMAVYTFDEHFNLRQVIEAEKANYTPGGWRLLDGTVTVFSKGDSFPLSQQFKEKELVIEETPTDFQEIEKEVDGLRIKELYQYIQRTRDSGVDTKANEVKLQSRISLSFIPLVMCILGVPFSVRNRREGGLARDLGLCLGVTFFYWLFYSVGLSLGRNGALPPMVAAWSPTAIFGTLAVFLIARRQH